MHKSQLHCTQCTVFKMDISQLRFLQCSMYFVQDKHVNIWTITERMYSNVYGRVKGWGGRKDGHLPPPQPLPCLIRCCTSVNISQTLFANYYRLWLYIVQYSMYRLNSTCWAEQCDPPVPYSQLSGWKWVCCTLPHVRCHSTRGLCKFWPALH